MAKLMLLDDLETFAS